MKIIIPKIFKTIYSFYYDGFTNMKTGKTLWLLIGVKLFVMFVIIKWLFFPNVLQEKFQTDEQRGNYILQQLTEDR